MTTPSSASRVASLLDAVPEPDRRAWLLPGALAPVCRVRRAASRPVAGPTAAAGPAAAVFELRLAPGDPRRGPGSADRCTVTVRDGRLDCAQRPGRLARAVVGGSFVAAWAVATLLGTYALVAGAPRWLAAVPVVLVLRTLAETGRRLDERRYRTWLRRLLAGDGAPGPASGGGRSRGGAPRGLDVAAAPSPRPSGAPVWSVPEGDCTG